MRKIIKPSKAGLLVRDHKSNFRPIPDEGKDVEWDTTWARRLKDGDIVNVEPKAQKFEGVAEPKPEKKPLSEKGSAFKPKKAEDK